MSNYRHLSFSDGPPPVEAPTPEQIAGGIRDLYMTLYRQYNPRKKAYGTEPLPRWDGGTDAWGAKHAPVWPKIAEELLRRNIDPAVFLHVQFSETVGRPSPKPNMLLSKDAFIRYEAYLQRADSMLKADYSRSAALVQRRLLQLEPMRGTPDQKMLTVIMDENVVQACPLYRYCFAYKFSLTPALERYHGSALQQYVFQPDLYDRAWGQQVIPPQLRQEAQAIRARMAY